ncbi:MAG TPA: YMGG-like glycine zipper-containing protein [bacterium]|nr:YMGG-like glycine zipper-containing protein [bacterium]HPO10119.1 YMGG-like glycine zipper-containing protein [bacterium]HQP98445.1 YMGG-like glycine zipper-containing protein [bacterium]
MNTNVKLIPMVGMVLLVAAPLVLTGCTTLQTTAVGTALGAGVGAIAGHQSGRAGEGVAIGAGAGALTGALVGSMMENHALKAERRAIERSNRVAYSGGSGNWIDGHYEYVVKKEWVDTTTTERVWVKEYQDGDRRIEGHYEVRKVPSGYYREYEEKIWIPGHYE